MVVKVDAVAIKVEGWLLRWMQWLSRLRDGCEGGCSGCRG